MTIGQFINECTYFEYSQEYFEINKEISELELIEKYNECIDNPLFEATNKTPISARDKKVSLWDKIWSKITEFFAKFIRFFERLSVRFNKLNKDTIGLIKLLNNTKLSQDDVDKILKIYHNYHFEDLIKPNEISSQYVTTSKGTYNDYIFSSDSNDENNNDGNDSRIKIERKYENKVKKEFDFKPIFANNVNNKAGCIKAIQLGLCNKLTIFTRRDKPMIPINDCSKIIYDYHELVDDIKILINNNARSKNGSNVNDVLQSIESIIKINKFEIEFDNNIINSSLKELNDLNDSINGLSMIMKSSSLQTEKDPLISSYYKHISNSLMDLCHAGSNTMQLFDKILKYRIEIVPVFKEILNSYNVFNIKKKSSKNNNENNDEYEFDD